MEIDVLDLDFGATVNGEVDLYGIPDNGILLRLDIDLAVEETLVGIESLDDVGGCFRHIVGELPSPSKIEPFVQILLLTLSHAGEQPSGHPRTLLDADHKESGVLFLAQMVYLQGHVLEIPLHPKPGHDRGDVIAWHSDSHAFLESGQRDDLLAGELVVSLHGNTSHIISLWVVIIYFNGGGRFYRILSKGRNSGHGQGEKTQ